MADSDDILRVLISTDNHLGVWEKDEVRKDDSFVSFEEVFEIAAAHHADFVLLGGDLFHDNKPSRHTVVRAMEILSKHCLGDNPVQFQVLSDQAQNFTTGRVNYTDPNYNIDLPVMTIHGNHDDPAGAENLSAVDILSTCRLVNYFGKAAIEGAGVGKLRISPVLLAKGETRVALYGLGNLRDERLCRLFQTPGCVEWVRPAPTPDIRKDDWFNIFVLHQNRVPHTQNAKNCLREGALARFLDVVVWGHEHECKPEPQESTENAGAFSVVQPGSSVATALSEGESKRKHCIMLEIRGSQWRMVKHRLETVRPFQYRSVVLAEQAGLDPDNQDGVAEFLEATVQSMIDQAAAERTPKSPTLPLIRLRVDYSGFSTINTQRFGQKFVGRVANPNDMVLWQKSAQRRQKDAAAAAAGGMHPGQLIRPEALDESRIEDLIGQHLQQNLEILHEHDLTEALHEFVEKDNKDSMKEAVARLLQETQTTALRDERATQAEQDDDLVNIVLDVSHKRKESQAAASAAQRASQAQRNQEQQAQQERAQGGSIANGLPAALRQQVSNMQLGDDDDDLMADDGPSASHSMPPPPARGRPPRAPAAAAAAAAPRRTAAAGRGKGKAAAGGGTVTASVGGSRQSPLNFAPTSSRYTQQEDNTSSVGVAAGRRGSTRAAATKTKKRLAATYKDAGRGKEDGGDEDSEAEVEVEDLVSSGDDDMSEDDLELEAEELEEPPSRKRGRQAAPPAAAPATGASKRLGGAGTTQPSQPTGGAPSFVISDDEDEAVQPLAGRRRVGGAGMLGPGGAGGKLQLPFGSFGTGSQQVSKGWGDLR